MDHDWDIVSGVMPRRTLTGLIMSHTVSVILCSFALLAEFTVATADEQTPDPTKAPARFALLIGVEKYARLGSSEQLNGAVNDCELMKSVLMNRFGFAEADIVLLLNEQATGQRIRAELAQLIARVKHESVTEQPTQVFLHFSGHGSQVADQLPGHADRDEPDGLDETLVPYDASRQGGAEDIRDDEIYRAVDEICADGHTRLFVVLDCCHSGTGARGTTRIRKLRRDTAVAAVPHAAAPPATQRKLPAGAVILSACRSLEVEPEYQFGGRHYGLLSRFAATVMSEYPRVSELSYSSLREALIVRYRMDSSVRQPPEPQIEGDPACLNSAVLSASPERDRRPWWPVIPVSRLRDVASLQAGRIHGISEGTLFEVFGSPETISGDSDQSVWLRVDRVEATFSEGVVLKIQDGKEIASQLPFNWKQGYAVERRRGNESAQLQVAIVQALSANTDSAPLAADDPLMPEQIRRAINAPDALSWLQVVGNEQKADVLIRWEGNRAAVFPATSGSPVRNATAADRRQIPVTLAGGWGPVDHTAADAADQLKTSLHQIVRARNLLRIAHAAQADPDNSIRVQLELMKIDIDDNANITRAVPWNEEGGALLMPEGSLYTVRVTNLSPDQKPVYVSVLMVDADMGIDHIIPYQSGSSANDEQRLPAGEAKLGGPFQCAGAEGEAVVAGPRTAIVLATREPNDFYRLTQPSLPVTRSLAAAGDSLQALLLDQVYFQTTRGDVRLRPQKRFDNSWTATTLEWKVVP